MNTILSILFLLFFWTYSQAQSSEDAKKVEVAPRIQSVNFTLENKTDKTIPLFIPSVMNPNLSPDSHSGVRLKFGQKVLFKYRGKKRVLLVIDESILEGEKIDVAVLIQTRKLEIDAQKQTPSILR